MHEDHSQNIEPSELHHENHAEDDFKLIIFKDNSHLLDFKQQNKICDPILLEDLHCESYLSKSDEEKAAKPLKTRHEILSWAAQEISLSPNASAMLNEAKKQGWSISIEALESADFHLDIPQKTIILDNQDLVIAALGKSSYFKNELLISFIRALRDVWQESRHGGFDKKFDAESVLILERIRAADLDVISTFIAWELRDKGQAYLWRHFIGSHDGDLAICFLREIERKPYAASTHKALFTVFKQCFNDPSRIADTDHRTLNYMDTVIENSHTTDAAFGPQSAEAIDIEAISSLPDKTSYLQGKGQNIASNRHYVGLKDEINKTHFAQIIYDLNVTHIQGVPFRNAELADKIFPDGKLTPSDAGENSCYF